MARAAEAARRLNEKRGPRSARRNKERSEYSNDRRASASCHVLHVHLAFVDCANDRQAWFPIDRSVSDDRNRYRSLVRYRDSSQIPFHSINRNLSSRRLLCSSSISRLHLTFDESDLTIERETSIRSSTLLGYYGWKNHGVWSRWSPGKRAPKGVVYRYILCIILRCIAQACERTDWPISYKVFLVARPHSVFNRSLRRLVGSISSMNSSIRQYPRFLRSFDQDQASSLPFYRNVTRIGNIVRYARRPRTWKFHNFRNR